QLQPRLSPWGSAESAMAVRCTSAAAGSAVFKQAAAPWYRALMLPIAPSVGRTTTRRPGSIWATMVSGVLAHEAKKRAAQAALFLRSTLSVLDSWPEQIERA